MSERYRDLIVQGVISESKEVAQSQARPSGRPRPSGSRRVTMPTYDDNPARTMDEALSTVARLDAEDRALFGRNYNTVKPGNRARRMGTRRRNSYVGSMDH
jgi:hypothetical protein